MHKVQLLPQEAERQEINHRNTSRFYFNIEIQFTYDSERRTPSRVHQKVASGAVKLWSG